jgi:hypothetical protein
MIAANKRFLKANLTQGVLGIQTNLIQLYSNNLSAVATQAALIGGFSFTAVSTFANTTNLKQLSLSYFYYVCFTVCLVAALFVLSQSTVVVMFGPTMALKGSTDEAVKVAAGHMMAQQFLIFQIAALSITALFLGSCILSWANYPVGIATITTVIYLIGYYYVIKMGFEAYSTFVTGEQGAFLEPDSDISVGSLGYKPLSEEGAEAANTATLLQAQENVRTKLKAILWKRQSIEEGGLFVKYFAVLEKGRLDFYYREKDYRENSNPVNLKPVKLWQFDLETDHRKYSKKAVSLSSAMKTAMIGNEDFSLADAMGSEFDLQYASKNFKFGLIPKVSSELNAAVIYEFLAHDEKTYKQWTTALSTVVKSYDLIAAMPSIEHTIRVGSSDVEMVVQAANNV